MSSSKFSRTIFPAVVVVICAWAAISRFTDVPTTITVSGKPLVTVESRNAAKAVISKVRLDESGDIPSKSVRFSKPVRYQKASDGAEIADTDEAVSALKTAVGVETELYCIMVDNKPLVGLESKEDTEKALELLKSRYEDKTGRKHTESTFKETVLIDHFYIDPHFYQSSPEKAVEAMTIITEKPVYHTVVPGDRTVKLAVRYGISLAELKSCNPQINIDYIVEGDRLLVKRPKLPITVVSKSLVHKTNHITSPPEMGRRYSRRTGTREMEVMTTSENGEPVSEDIISQITTWENPDRDHDARPRSRHYQHR